MKSKELEEILGKERSCFNCLHHFMNHSDCDSQEACVGHQQWIPVRNPLSVYKNPTVSQEESSSKEVAETDGSFSSEPLLQGNGDSSKPSTVGYIKANIPYPNPISKAQMWKNVGFVRGVRWMKSQHLYAFTYAFNDEYCPEIISVHWTRKGAECAMKSHKAKEKKRFLKEQKDRKWLLSLNPDLSEEDRRWQLKAFEFGDNKWWGIREITVGE